MITSTIVKHSVILGVTTKCYATATVMSTIIFPAVESRHIIIYKLHNKLIDQNTQIVKHSNPHFTARK